MVVLTGFADMTAVKFRWNFDVLIPSRQLCDSGASHAIGLGKRRGNCASLGISQRGNSAERHRTPLLGVLTGSPGHPLIPRGSDST